MSAYGVDQSDNLRASSVRVALSVFAAATLPFVVPGMAGHLPVLIAYAAGAYGFHVAIRRGFGGISRFLLGGAMDVACITFLVHQLGTQSTPLVCAYVLSGMFNTLVASSPWPARFLGLVGLVAYAGVSVASALGILPYAPAVPELAAFVPSLDFALAASALLAVLVAVSMWVAERLAHALRLREQQLREANVTLEQLSQRDPLTQLYNRRYFVQRVEEELARVRRGHPLALLMMDLDGFKHINDERGHLAGDELLQKLARAVESSTRVIDVVGRFGGDEFVALLPDTETEQAMVVADRLVRTVRTIGTEADPRRPVTVSVGVAIARVDDDVAVLLNLADAAAYLAKDAGGDRVQLAAPSRSSVNVLDSSPRVARAG